MGAVTPAKALTATTRAASPAPSPASPSTARAINDRLALQLLQEEGPLTAPSSRS